MPYAIGVQHIKKEVNIGTLFRSAYNFDASWIFTIGRRYQYQSSDTCKATRHIGCFNFPDTGDFLSHTPKNWELVAVELVEDAGNIFNFIHPRAAIYILGPEDGSVNKNLLERCRYKIYIPSKRCLNVSVAGSIVMYDRILKNHDSSHISNTA